MRNFDLMHTRILAGLSVNQAAELIGVCPATFYRWEKGLTKIPDNKYAAFLLETSEARTAVLKALEQLEKLKVVEVKLI